MYKRVWKRLFDILFTILALCFFWPLLGLIAFLVCVTLGRPILFRQKRPGLNGKLFTLFKFRTMTDAYDAEGNFLSDSERLTSFGRFLRAASFDELPELFNILHGEMSLVGPRPLLTRYTPFFLPEERLRFLVRPGLTGLSQVKGRNDLSWDMRIAGDVDYVRRCSLSLDIQIICITFWRVILRRDLRVNPGASMLDFDEERRIRPRFSKEDGP